MIHGQPQILMVADDFGLNAETNAAILHTHHHGALKYAALMMGQPGTDEAIQRARETPSLHLGIHFHWNDSLPLTCPAWPWGNRPALAGWSIGLQHSAYRLMLHELEAQWDAYRASGLPCRFINSHHHLHLHPRILSALLTRVSKDFSGWIRMGTPRFFSNTPILSSITSIVGIHRQLTPFPSPQTLWGIDRTFQMNPHEVRTQIESLTCGVHEFIFHPRRIENDLDTECLIQLKLS